MAQTKTTSVAAAARRVHRHPKTVRRWCAERNFGVLVGGRWEIPNENLKRIERALKLANGSQVLRRSSESPL
ncbi:MAG: hypothetical protein WCB70_05320 [Xanthobacteraceae bacterium]